MKHISILTDSAEFHFFHLVCVQGFIHVYEPPRGQASTLPSTDTLDMECIEYQCFLASKRQKPHWIPSNTDTDKKKIS